ncbi:response regulator [Paraherbaspirillum soli]|uniref:Response regulator n=1 Tax=Paraherbaspirillum soli TaxID=631222 RepID=A0ABW0M928_9BURK
MKRVVVIDDHPAILLAIKYLMEKDGEYVIVAQAKDGEDGLQKIRQHSPDLLIIDLGLPKLDGIALIEAVRKLDPDVRILVLSGQQESLFVSRTLQAGANSYVSKQQDLSEMLNAAKAIMAGFNCFPSTPEISDGERIRDSLSKRELSVLKLLALGYSNKKIGAELCISSKTVSSHKVHLYEKLNVKTRSVVSLADFAKAHQLIP